MGHGIRGRLALFGRIVFGRGGGGAGGLEAVEPGESPAFVVEAAGVFGQAELEGGGFHTADAAEAPGGHDELLNEEDFDGAEGLVMLFVSLGDFVELVLVFEREDGVLGGESMFEGVEANGGLARGGLGTSGVEGIGAVRVNLFLGSHGGHSLGE